MAYPAWFPLPLRTTGLEVTPPIAVWTLTYKSLIKKRPSQTCLQANSIEAILRSRFLLPSYVLSWQNPTSSFSICLYILLNLSRDSLRCQSSSHPTNYQSVYFPSIFSLIQLSTYPFTHKSIQILTHPIHVFISSASLLFSGLCSHHPSAYWFTCHLPIHHLSATHHLFILLPSCPYWDLTPCQILWWVFWGIQSWRKHILRCSIFCHYSQRG